MEKQFSIIIPAAGVGRRMKSYGPKALIRLGETNVIARQLEILQSVYPKSDIVVVTGFENWKIEEFVESWKNERVLGSRDIKLVHNKRFNETNVAQSIALATEFCSNENYLLVYGDLVFNKETFSETNWQQSGVLLDRQNQFDKLEAGAILDEQNKIIKFCYDSIIKWSQIAYLEKDYMSVFLELLDNPNRSRYFSFEIFNLMLDKMNLRPYFNSQSKIVELDHSENIQQAKKLVRGEV